MSQRKVDVAVIGGGTAGLAAYRAAREEGASAVLVEKGPYGTTCARVGCMPSKLLIAAADAAHKARQAGPFGVHATVSVDGRAVMDRVRRERDRFVGFVLDGVASIPEEARVSGAARFVSPSEIEVEGPDGSTRIEARGVVVATGSSPTMPKMFAPAGDRAVVSDAVFAWETLPSSVAVFGAGVIGLELGQALGRLGVRVRIFGQNRTVAHLGDPFVRDVAEAILARELPIHSDAKVETIERTEHGVRVSWIDGAELRSEEFEFLLVATGRRPNLDRLGLENAGAGPNAKVDRHTLRLGESHVFVSGDASEDVPLLHEAADEGRIAGQNAATFPFVRSYPRRSSIAIAFTDPGCAMVGSGFRALRAKGDPFAVGVVSFDDQGRSRVMRENHGVLRVYADPSTRRFLGAEMIAPRAEHLAHLLAWAHQEELTIDDMLGMPFYHPVVEEGVRTALRDAKAKLDAGDTIV